MFHGLCPFVDGGSFGTWGWVAMILQVILWLGLIAGVVFLFYLIIRWSARVPATVPGQSSEIEILQARYARGEITRELYQQMLGDLK
jgi:putative membrane protein